MDGAIICDKDAGNILRAAVQLVPDSSIETQESGTRHRTAERVAIQTGVPVISVSQSMQIIALYVNGLRHVLEGSEKVLARANQALATLERYRSRLDQVTSSLSALEIEAMVTVRDVAVTLQRQEMVRRISEEISQYVLSLARTAGCCPSSWMSSPWAAAPAATSSSATTPARTRPPTTSKRPSAPW